MRNLTPSAAGHFAMLLFSVLIAGSFSLGSLAANEIAPAALNAVRFWLAAGVLVGVVWLRFADPWAQIVRAARAPWRYLILGGLFGGYLVAMFEGLKTAPPVSSAAVFTLTPLMSAGFGWIWLRQRFTARMGLALALGAAGAMWVIFRADLAAMVRFEIGRGEAIFFWGCVGHAAYTPLVRVLNRGEPALVGSLGMLTAGALLLAVWGLPAMVATDWAALPPVVWITLFYVAFCASSATAVLVQFASMRLPSAKVMAYTYLTPSWVLIWEAALGAPPPPGWILAGVALTALALLLLLRDE